MYLIICFGYFIRHMVCKYFPCSVGCLLILLIVSFNAQSALLSIFSFVAHAFGVIKTLLFVAHALVT